MNFTTKFLRTRKIAFLTLALLFPQIYAEKAIEIKIIEGRKLLSMSDEGKKIESDLQSKKESIDKSLMSLENKLKGEITNLETKLKGEITSLSGKAKVLDAETLEKEQEKIMKLKNEYEVKVKSAQEELQNKSKNAQEEFQRSFSRELGKFQKKINDEIKDLSIKNGWDIVIIKESGEIVYSSEKTDASSEILQALNKKYKATTPVSAPAVKK